MTSATPPSSSPGLPNQTTDPADASQPSRSTRQSTTAITTAITAAIVPETELLTSNVCEPSSKPTPTTISTSTAITINTSSTTSNGTYMRHNAPPRSKVKPRWHTQPYMVFLALRSMPNRTATRHELLAAAVELDRKFSAEKGLPRVFTGKVKQAENKL